MTTSMAHRDDRRPVKKAKKYQSQFIQLESFKNIEEITTREFDDEIFFNQFVRPLKPAKITGELFNIEPFKSDNIVETAKDEFGNSYEVQIERKIGGGFGTGSERQRVRFDEFIRGAVEGKHDGYLTTQYGGEESENSGDEEEQNYDNEQEEESDEEEELGEEGESYLSKTPPVIPTEINKHTTKEDEESNYSDSGTSSIFNTSVDDFDPLDDPSVFAVIDGQPMDLSEAWSYLFVISKPLISSLIAKKIPTRPKICANLAPQQINIWIGTGKSKDAPSFKSDFASRRDIPGFGVSSGLHHDHASNLYVVVQGKKRFTLFPPSDVHLLYTIGDVERVFDSGVIDYKRNENAPKWKHVTSDGSIDLDRNNLSSSEIESDVKDPPSFSKIPPSLLHIDEFSEHDQITAKNLLDSEYPKLKQANKIVVELEEGEMLYLPAGWFHEVTSYGGKDNVHIALNYWFYPANGKTYDKPYLDSKCGDDWKTIEKIFEALRQGAHLDL